MALLSFSSVSLSFSNSLSWSATMICTTRGGRWTKITENFCICERSSVNNNTNINPIVYTFLAESVQGLEKRVLSKALVIILRVTKNDHSLNVVSSCETFPVNFYIMMYKFHCVHISYVLFSFTQVVKSSLTVSLYKGTIIFSWLPYSYQTGKITITELLGCERTKGTGFFPYSLTLNAWIVILFGLGLVRRQPLNQSFCTKVKTLMDSLGPSWSPLTFLAIIHLATKRISDKWVSRYERRRGGGGVKVLNVRIQPQYLRSCQ